MALTKTPPSGASASFIKGMLMAQKGYFGRPRWDKAAPPSKTNRTRYGRQEKDEPCDCDDCLEHGLMKSECGCGS